MCRNLTYAIFLLECILHSCNQYDRMIKKKCKAMKEELVPIVGKDIRALPVEKSTASTTTIGGKKRGYEGSKTTGSNPDKKRGKYMSFSHRLQLQREAEQKFAKFVRFLL